MLDAFVKKHVRRILLTRAAEHQNNKNEDAITSMVFTPIRFMAAEDAFMCLKAILPQLPARLAGRSATSVKIELWPSIAVGDVRVEPDLRAEVQFMDGSPLVMIGEMKWESVITKEQILRETEAVKGKDAYIFAIVKSRRSSTAVELGCDELRTWTDVHRSVLELSSSHLPVRNWATLVSQFLQIAEQLVFSGFGDINLAELPSLDQSVMFFSRQGSNGHFNRHFEFPAPDGIPEKRKWVFYDRRDQT
jgi:hypothetical protein